MSAFRRTRWNDPLDDVVAEVLRDFGGRERRGSLAAPRAFAELLELTLPRACVIVGTNGKSSAATFLARLMTAGGQRAGLFTSPHLRSWTERIRIDDRPVSDAEFAHQLRHVHRAALTLPSALQAQLRFFDLITFAAVRQFHEQGVEIAVYEAGIGGRLDVTACLGAELAVLTSIGDDHAELLGRTPEERLAEKALVLRPGGRLIAAPLGSELDAELQRLAAAHGLTLQRVESGADPGGALPDYQHQNLLLARAAARELGSPAADAEIDLEVGGRHSRGEIGGVAYIADVAHNPTAWSAFLHEAVTGPVVGVVAATTPRDPAQLVGALLEHRDALRGVVCTTTSVRDSVAPERIAEGLRSAGVRAVVVEEPQPAFAAAVALAAEAGAGLVAFGSNYLVSDFEAWLTR